MPFSQSPALLSLSARPRCFVKNEDCAFELARSLRAVRVLLFRDDERHSILQSTFASFQTNTQLASDCLGPNELDSHGACRAFGSHLEKSGGKPTFSLPAIPAGNSHLVHLHLSRSGFDVIVKTPPFTDSACPLGWPPHFPCTKACPCGLGTARHNTRLLLSLQYPLPSAIPFRQSFPSLPARRMMRGKSRRKSIQPHDPASPTPDPHPKRSASQTPFYLTAIKLLRAVVSG